MPQRNRLRGPFYMTEEKYRLWQAAPGLLEAAQNIEAHARKHTDGTVRLDAAWLDDLRSAIARAKGGDNATA